MPRVGNVISLRPVAWRGPLSGGYWPAVAMVLAALTPFLVPHLGDPAAGQADLADVGLGNTGMEMSAGMADAAYCFGTILAVQLTASDPGAFFAGRIVQGLRLQAPEIDRWQEGDGPATGSSPLGAALRRRLLRPSAAARRRSG